MKKLLLKSAAAAILMFTVSTLFAQTRYIDNVFNDVLKTTNIEYDSNRSVNILFGAVPGQLPIITARLRCDIYQPVGDTITKRPVVIVMHTGSYLPAIVNRQATGSKNDSAIVEVCTQFAKKGYVAVAMENRMGWNPQTTISEVATEQLLKATYRGIQDARNCIRFLRSNANTYGIDTSMIVVGGQGTGGYIAYALGSVDRRSEIEQNLKFLRNDANASPMVSVDTLGDWNGLGGIALPSYPFYYNYSGDPSISGNAHMTFNFGGAMGDLAWLESSSLPVVSLQVVSDPFAPYLTGNVIVPTTNVTVIPDASGAGNVIPKANSVGVNNKINAAVYNDPYSTKALQLSGGEKNLYPFYVSFPFDSAPWEWWDSTVVKSQTSGSFYGIPVPADGVTAHNNSMQTNPTMSAIKARAYIDTIVNFVAPRIAVQFDLVNFTGIKEVASLNNQLTVFPVPAHDVLNIQLPVNMESVSVLDITGRVLMTERIQGTSGRMETTSLHQGIYFAQVKTVDGRVAVKRFVVE